MGFLIAFLMVMMIGLVLSTAFGGSTFFVGWNVVWSFYWSMAIFTVFFGFTVGAMLIDLMSSASSLSTIKGDLPNIEAFSNDLVGTGPNPIRNFLGSYFSVLVRAPMVLLMDLGHLASINNGILLFILILILAAIASSFVAGFIGIFSLVVYSSL